MWNILLIGTFLLATFQLPVQGDVSHLVGQHHNHNHPGYGTHKPTNPLELPEISTENHHHHHHPGYPKEKPNTPFIHTSGTGNKELHYIPPITDSTGASTGGVNIQTTHGHHEHHYHGEDGKYNPHDDGRGWDIRKSVPGEPELDYPTLGSVPRTAFTCREKVPGYYADTEARCQVFRICTTRSSNSFTSFLCPNGTLFNQVQLTCDWWNNVDCENSDHYYYKNNDIGKMPEGPQLMYEINKMLQAPFQYTHKYESDNQLQGTVTDQQGVYLPPKQTTTTQATYHLHQQHGSSEESVTDGYKYPKPEPTPNQIHLQKQYQQQQQFQQSQHRHQVPQQQQQQHQHQVPQQQQHQHQVPQQQHQQHQEHQVPHQHEVVQTSQITIPIKSYPENNDNSHQHGDSSRYDSSSISSINLPDFPTQPTYGTTNNIQVGQKESQDTQIIQTGGIPIESPHVPEMHVSTTVEPQLHLSTTVEPQHHLSTTVVPYSSTSTTTQPSSSTTIQPSSSTTIQPSSSTTIQPSSSTTPKLHLSQISKPNPQPLYVSKEKTKANSQSSKDNQLFTSPIVPKEQKQESEEGGSMLFTSPFISRKTQIQDAQPLFVSPEIRTMLFTSPLVSKSTSTTNNNNNALFTSPIKTPNAPKAPEAGLNKVQFLSPQIGQQKPAVTVTNGNSRIDSDVGQTNIGPQKISLLDEGKIGVSLPIPPSTVQTVIATHASPVSTTAQTIPQQQEQQQQQQSVLNIQEQFDKHNPFKQGVDVAAINQVFGTSGEQQQQQQQTGLRQYQQYGVPPQQTQINTNRQGAPNLSKEQAFEAINKLQNDLTEFYNQNKQQTSGNTDSKITGEGLIDIRDKTNNPLTIPANTFGVSGKNIQFGSFPQFQDRSGFGAAQTFHNFNQHSNINPYQQQQGFIGYNYPNQGQFYQQFQPQNQNIKYEFSKDASLNNYNGQGVTYHSNGGQTHALYNGQSSGFKETTKVEIVPAISFEITDHLGPNYQSFLSSLNNQEGSFASPTENTYTVRQKYPSSDARFSTYQGPSSYLVPQKSVLQLPSDSGFHR